MTATRKKTTPRRKKAQAQPKPQTTTEAQYQAAVIELAQRCGWLIYHDYDSRRSTRGFPDLCMVRGGRLLFIELKTMRGRIRPEQVLWINKLRECGVTAFVARLPEDWPNIERELIRQAA